MSLEKSNAVPYENRKYKSCDILEDEFHFLLECLLYAADRRKRYVQRYCWQRPNIPKFIKLLFTELCKP